MASLIGLTPRLLLATVGLLLALPALAQSEPMPSEPMRTAPENRSADNVPQPGPTTPQLNRRAGSYYAQRQYLRRAERTARYRADRRSYMRALIAHDRAVNQYDRRYVRKQRAYAAAMAATGSRSALAIRDPGEPAAPRLRASPTSTSAIEYSDEPPVQRSGGSIVKRLQSS